MKKSFITLLIISTSLFTQAQVDIFFSPSGEGLMDGSSWENAACGSLSINMNSFNISQPSDVNLHFMEGDYYNFELFAQDYGSYNYISLNIFGGYSLGSSGTDLTMRDAANFRTIFYPQTTPSINTSPFTAIYINIGYINSNTINTIDGIVLNGYSTNYDVAAIWACGAPALITNCEIYGFGHYNPLGTGGSASSVSYSYLLWLEHANPDIYSTIKDCNIHDNIANVLITHVGNFWIENTSIYINSLETDFIWAQNGGDFIDINNNFYSNTIGGSNINSVDNQSRMQGQLQITIDSNKLSPYYDLLTNTTTAKYYILSLDGKFIQTGEIRTCNIIPITKSYGSYMLVIKTGDGLTRKYLL